MSAVRALFRINFDVCQRSRGGDAVKLAAYNACSRITHAGRTYDFRRKAREHVGETLLLVPDGFPRERFRNPGDLWRAAEAAENRGNSQTARQVLITIPREVPADRRQAFILHCVEPLVESGMVLQIDLHDPGARDGEAQPHAHVLATMRELAEDGPGFARTKAKGRDWNRLFTENRGRAMRSHMADRMNGWFQENGLECHVDHRTNAEADGQVSIPPEPQVSRAAVEQAKRAPDTPPAEIARLDTHRRQRRAVREIDASLATTQARIREIRAAQASRPPAQNTQAGRPRPMAEKLPWMQATDGVAGLSPAHLASARRSYDRWKDGQVRRGKKEEAIFGFDAYVDYVQDRRSRDEQNRGVPRIRDNKEAAFDASPTPPPSPDPDERGWTRRKRFLANLLAEHYAVDDLDPSVVAHIKRIQLDRDARTATVHLADGTSFVDHGDRIEFRGAISQPSATEIAAAAARHGWTSVQLTGSPDFREETAIALAMREPPIEHDHELSPAAAARLAAALAEREAARPVSAGIAPAPASDAPAPTVNSIAPVAPAGPEISAQEHYRLEGEWEAAIVARYHETETDGGQEDINNAHPHLDSPVPSGTGTGPVAATRMPPSAGGGAAGDAGVSAPASGSGGDSAGNPDGGVVGPPPSPRNDAPATAVSPYGDYDTWAEATDAEIYRLLEQKRQDAEDTKAIRLGTLARSDAEAAALLNRRPTELNEKTLRGQGAKAIRDEEARLKAAVAEAQTAAETATRNRSLLSAASRRTATEAAARLTAAREAIAAFERTAVERYEGSDRIAADAARFSRAEARAFDARPDVIAALRQKAVNAVVRDAISNPASDPELASALERDGLTSARQFAANRIEQRAQQQAAAEAEQQAEKRAAWAVEDAQFEQRRAHRFGG